MSTETTSSTQPGQAPAGFSFTLSERAAKRINAIVARQQNAAALRLAVLGGGCSGFQYEFGFAEAPG